MLVGVALKRGLQPLRNLGERAESIDVSTLDTRFDSGETPAELRPIYERLNDLMVRIETAFERERLYSSNLAHEMRTPVAELKMISEVALKWPDQAGPATHLETLEIANQLEMMIVNLLALARWESGEVPLKSEAIDLNTLVRECWEPCRKLAADKKQRVRFDLSAKTVVTTDGGMLRHIFNNLLSNSAEYTPEGEEIVISSFERGIEIANAAPNLDQSDLDRLFDRFWRHDSARTDARHAGLGLSLARACAGVLGFRLVAKLQDGTLRFRLEF